MSRPTGPAGSVESIRADGRSVVVQEWALDPNGGRPPVLMSLNGLPARLIPPDRPRPDRQAVLAGELESGFEERLAVGRGTHRVCVAWADAQSGAWEPPFCRDVVVK